jgi:hypothetical protein
MTAKKIIVAVVLLLSATPAFAQSAWTTGTEASRVAAGYPSPYGQSFYDYAPRINAQRHIASHSGLSAYARVQGFSSSSDANSAAETGGGSLGYNELLLQH